MKICNPQQFIKSLDKDTLSRIEERFGGINRFLDREDKFRFTCDKSGTCCKNRFDSPIMVAPYDAYRIQERLKINFEEFISKYVDRILGSESQLPMMLLKFPKNEIGQDKCVFLKSSHCDIYDDRPIVCRMFPVGRFTDKEMNSYFFITETSDICQFGKGKEYSLVEWLKQSNVEPFIKWSNRYNRIFLNMNNKKYQKTDFRQKYMFGNMLFDFDFIEKTCNGERPAVLNKKGKDARLVNSYILAKYYAEKHFS